MKHFISQSIFILFFAGIFSCKKDSTEYLNGAQVATPLYHVSFYDHKTGEKITGLEVALKEFYPASTWPEDWDKSYYSTGSVALKTDATGSTIFSRPNSRYLTVNSQVYVGALYNLYPADNVTTQPAHAQEGSGGPNVVYTKLLRKEDNDLYFRAELYRKSPIDIHIIQLTDYADTLNAFFNASIKGTDPSNSTNTFGTNDLLRNGIPLNANKKIDTTITVYGFGDYLNKVNWSVYTNVNQQNGLIDIQGRKFISAGDLPEKIFPSDTPSSITITF